MSHTVEQLEPGELAAARALLLEAVDAATATVADEKLFGPAADAPATPLAVHCGGRLAGVAVASGAWLRLLAVHPAHRRLGVGSALLAAAEDRCRAAGARSMRALDQPGNYLWPGVPHDDAATLAWLERRGFRRGPIRTNLLIELAGNPRVSVAAYHSLAARAGYPLHRVRDRERPGLCDWIAREFSRGWAFEVARGDTYVAIDEAGDPAGFANHDGNNRGLGWFGPAGTLSRYRGRGLGAALLMACLVDILETGPPVCTVAWIGPRGFYERVAGVAAQRDYIAMTKEFV
jgi:GNAT superfamily N-acetyltransferase